MSEDTFQLDQDHIELCTLLKLVGPRVSGGMAKHMIANGEITVDGHIETRKKCKIRAGQTIESDGFMIRVVGTS